MPSRSFAPSKALLWLNVLSLDAPLVAVIWQDFFARTFSLKLDLGSRLVLALSIWLAYSADRWLDGWRIPRGASVTPRHRFAQDHRVPLAWVWVLVLCGTISFAWFALPVRLFERGSILVFGVAVYFVLNQLPKTNRFLRGFKELVIGILFAAGTVIFIAPRPDKASLMFWWACATWFLLGVLNCYAIACWELDADRAEKQESLITRWPSLASCFKAMAIAISFFAVAPILFHSSMVAARFGCAVAASSIGLAMLDLGNGGLDTDFLRSAADLVLFTPLLFRLF
jgi:hypothetical protein